MPTMPATVSARVGTGRNLSHQSVNRNSSGATVRAAALSHLPLGSRRVRVREMIYLDYNATTPLDPAVVEAMLPYLHTHFGNPSSTHALGKVAHEAVEQARRQVAEFLGAHADEIVFTGGGSE